jgi:hypothetical protein
VQTIETQLFYFAYQITKKINQPFRPYSRQVTKEYELRVAYVMVLVASSIGGRNHLPAGVIMVN